MLRVLTICVLAVVVSACATHRGAIKTDPAFSQLSARFLSNANDPIKEADTLAGCIRTSIEKRRPAIGAAKGQLTISGGVATTVGLVGGAIGAALSADEDKARITLVTTLAGAAIGLYQVIKGVQRDPVGYIRDGDILLSDYAAAKIAAAADADKLRAAAVQLVTGAGKVAESHPEYADFRQDPACSAVFANIKP